ncbi:MAG: hypothetical protein F6K22_24430 [Okeania sp. SIO2F4]|uniref:hypothetical protein n=1 Tax=Okeania sp. SIO2F4 TaxID=2607790 RepID=UPI00142C50AA|nr:hypothetical protein [Okeania sp. SIO2F4]NES05679.1 hypothetical protein [Okeania sp. SIO2F4]
MSASGNEITIALSAIEGKFHHPSVSASGNEMTIALSAYRRENFSKIICQNLTEP